MSKVIRKSLSAFLLLIMIYVLYFVIPTKLLDALHGWMSAPYFSLGTFGLLLSCLLWIATLYVFTNWLLKKLGCDVDEGKIKTTRGHNEMDI